MTICQFMRNTRRIGLFFRDRITSNVFLTPWKKIKIWDKSGPFPGFFGVASAESSFKNWCKCMNSNLCTSKDTNKP